MIDSEDILRQIRSIADKYSQNGVSGDDVPPGWQLGTLAEAYADTEPTKFLVDGLLPLPSLTIVFGGPGSLKSMILADMAVCIAAGLPWLEPLPNESTPVVTLKTKEASVLWVDFDNGPRRTRERLAALGRGHNIPASNTNMRYVSMPDPWLDASDRAAVVYLAGIIRENEFKLVIIDNLGLVTGGTEENSGGMSQVMGSLRWLAESTECAVIVIHHQRKSNGANADSSIRKGESLRGHSSIEASLDLALLIERKNREDSILIVATKVRDYQDFDAFGALWTYEHMQDTKRMWSAKFYARSTVTSEETINIAIMAHIKNEMRGKGWMAAADTIQLVRDRMAAKPGGKAPGVNKVRGLMREMSETGMLIRRGEARNTEYSLL